MLTPPPIFSIFRAYQPSALRNVIEVPSDEEDNAEPCAESTEGEHIEFLYIVRRLNVYLAASASTGNSLSPTNHASEGPSSEKPPGPNLSESACVHIRVLCSHHRQASHADAPVDKENVPALPAAVNDATPSTSDAPPPSQSSTVTRFVSVRPLRPIVPLPKYRTAYRRFLRGKDLANTKSTQAPLIAQRLNNRVFKTQSETSRNLLRGIKRKWTPCVSPFALHLDRSCAHRVLPNPSQYDR